MTSGPVGTALACPSCGSDRVRRRFSFAAATGSAAVAVGTGHRTGRRWLLRRWLGLRQLTGPVPPTASAAG